jgi:aspartate carbamoyltransferase catalytic subunit
MTLAGSHIVSVSQFARSDLDRLYARADRCLDIARGERACHVLDGKVLANLFFEPSTRTRLSFGSAFLRLGGAVETTVGVQFSSMAKGETLEDTIRVIDGYADALVLRHPKVGAAARAAAVARHPLINAGDGAGEHPTQALLDAYTLTRERGRVDGLTIAMIGDLRYGRTVHSLARLLTRYEGVKILLTAPEELAMPAQIVADVRAAGVEVEIEPDLRAAARRADVLYVTRLQEERFADPSDAVRHMGRYVVDRALLEDAGRTDITILHPLPRVHDLSADVDDLPGAAYFRQTHFGVPVRMSLFCEVFGVEPD